MIRRASLALLLSTALPLTAVGSAQAGSLPPPNSGAISVYVPSTTGAGTSRPTYQGALAFSATGTGTLKNPRIWVSCYQSSILVYGAGASPSDVLKLGGDMSLWVMNGGGPASCTAALYYILNAKRTGEWTGKGAQGGTVPLAATTFEAAG
jgi:hypothetical protein